MRERARRFPCTCSPCSSSLLHSPQLFFLPGGGDSRLIGGTYFLSNDLAAHLDFGLNAPLHPSGPGTQSTTFSLSVGLRSYQFKRERVAVFLGPVAALGQEFSPAVSAETALFLRLGGGIGVEYFFTNHFSAGATFELTLKFADIAGPANNPIYTTVSTGSSSLGANIYF